MDAILDLIGVGWPNVDEDAYRDMAKDLRDFADDVDKDAHAAHQSMKLRGPEDLGQGPNRVVL
ncbi:hypothetical protein [Streptomyces sp. URMC 125]|uniref:hypothetical protein n=1 Tax=Streptomyces sp. URMC 125 TaxID=3423419 RepID=UPI003F1E08CB